jgi:DNA-directed RNA polymerase subunit RPC12/RpoP
MTKRDNEKSDSSRLTYWIQGYLYLTATLLALVGLFLLSTAWTTRNSTDRWLAWRDPLLGMSTRTLLVVGGLLHAAVAAYLFAARDLLNRTLAVLWLGLNHLLYYTGVHWLEPSAVTNAERFIGWRLQLQPETVVFRWKVFQGYLIVASAAVLILIWRQSTLLRKEAWFRKWRESRAQSPKRIEKRARSDKPKPTDEYMKIICSHCGQKIAFPLNRVGESIACPSCATRIVLREPPTQMV